jgi:hypothetical protein
MVATSASLSCRSFATRTRRLGFRAPFVFISTFVG